MPLSPFAVRKASSALQCDILAVVMGYIAAVVFIVLSFGILSRIHPDFFSGTQINIPPSTLFLTITLFLSLLAAVAGGFVTALLSQSSAKKLAVALGGFMIVLGIVTMTMEQGAKPLWWHLTLFLFFIPCTALGALLRLASAGRRRKKKW